MLLQAQELHSIFRFPFETLCAKAMHYMNSCIPQSLSNFHQRKRCCILHYCECFCFLFLKLDNRRQRHVPAVLLQQSDLPVPLESRLSGPYSRSGRFGVDKTPFPMPGTESLFLSFPGCCLVIAITT